MCLLAVVAAQAATTTVALVPNGRIPQAHGFARIDSEPGAVDLDVRLEGLKPATLFGGDYTTYVLWIIDRDGTPHNAGEFPLNGDESRLLARTHLPAFGIAVTAEPHFLVQVPSSFIVLENKPTGELFPSVRFDVASYYYERDTLSHAISGRAESPTRVHQALSAYRLAQRVHADQFAPAEFDSARLALDQTLRMARAGAAPDEIDAAAQQVVRLAADAESVVRQRALAGDLDSVVLNRRGVTIK